MRLEMCTEVREEVQPITVFYSPSYWTEAPDFDTTAHYVLDDRR